MIDSATSKNAVQKKGIEWMFPGLNRPKGPWFPAWVYGARMGGDVP